MTIEKNTVFCLSNNDKYMVLDKTDYEGKNYLYTVQVDDTLVRTMGKYSFFESKENLVSEIEDETLSGKLYDIFVERYLTRWGE